MVASKFRLRRLLRSGGGNNSIPSEDNDPNNVDSCNNNNAQYRKQDPQFDDVNKQKQHHQHSGGDGYYRYVRYLTSPFTSSSYSADGSDESTAENSSMASSYRSYDYGYPSPEQHQVDGINGTADPYADVRARMDRLCGKTNKRKQKQQRKLSNDSDNLQFSDSDSDDDNEVDDEASDLEEYNELPTDLDPEKNTTVIAWIVYLGWTILIILGRIREFVESIPAKLFGTKKTVVDSTTSETLAPLLASWESFFTRRIYIRFHDCFSRPIASNPGSHIVVLERVSDDEQKSMTVLGPLEPTDKESSSLLAKYENRPHFVKAHDGSIGRRCINLGSYNYLGFADDWQGTCAPTVKNSLKDLPVSSSSSPLEYGSTTLHRQLEETVARFLGKEDAIVFTMGFNTNATIIPALVSRGDLVISDKLNHTSIVTGTRSSGAAIRIFRHNDMKHLEKILRESVLLGRPRSRRPWNKILVIVEGIYSMEGEFAELKETVEICKKYGAYVYLDEAHSVGATGPTGRGCTEVLGVDSADIDVMMGTFTKSYGAMGGYVAADRDTIAMLRAKCVGSSFHNALSPTVCQQCLTAFKVCKITVAY